MNLRKACVKMFDAGAEYIYQKRAPDIHYKFNCLSLYIRCGEGDWVCQIDAKYKIYTHMLLATDWQVYYGEPESK